MVADINWQQAANGISFDFIGADVYYGNGANLARLIEQMDYIYTLDIHSDQKIFLTQPGLYLPQRKEAKGQPPKGSKPQPRI